MTDARTAYRRRAAEYIDAFGEIARTAAADRERIGAWAAERDGLIVDLGCGPGQWTGFLRERGARVIGIDPVDAFIVHARRQHPGIAFRVGSTEQLELPDDSVAGILAWYSLIHTAPAELPSALAELARVLQPGGSLLLGFFTGDVVAPFDHTVTTAYFWTFPALRTLLEDAGFSIRATEARTDEGYRPHGAIVATLRPGE